MRIKLTFEQERPNQIIPINYPYYISSYIYKTIANADSEYADWLHNSGFANGYKSFKFFTFSKIQIPKFKRIESNLQILSREISLIISFHIESTMMNMLKGLFAKSNLEINGYGCKANFNASLVEYLPPPEYKNEMEFHTTTPIFLSKQNINNPSPVFLKPEDYDYTEYFKKNLQEKYIAQCIFFNKQIEEKEINDIEILKVIKSEKITIKNGTSQKTDLRGYRYTFRINADKELIELGYNAGFGSKNSLGFGFAVENNKILKDDK